MGKKAKGNSLGRALIKDRFASRKPNKSQDSLLHTAELNDGYDWGRLNLQSVTEQSSFEEFLSTAQLAGTEFQAEKLNITFVNPNTVVKGTTKEEREKFEKTRQEKKKFIRIPRRPKWDESTTKEELDTLEKQTFLEWRRNLALIQEKDGLTLTPYEKNLEFWRQLWRVVERSDVVVQIVDARNPLLFRCEDLESYVTDSRKKNLLLVNKADLLTEDQRREWAEWFVKNKVEAVFFSATLAAEEGKDLEEEEEEEVYADAREELMAGGGAKVEVDVYLDASEELVDGSDTSEDWSDLDESSYDEDYVDASDEDTSDDQNRHSGAALDAAKAAFLDRHPTPRTPSSPLLEGRWKEEAVEGRLLGKGELIALLESLAEQKLKNVEGRLVTVGLVGYPNVGKSSTINALLDAKKVSVSATPGKTKHFQTILLSSSVMLCDCPGLVMPSLAHSKASMVLAGVLPPDRGGDLMEPVALLAALVGRTALERRYGVVIPPPPEGEAPDRHPTAHEFLSVYAYSRGFMTSGGRADSSRAARYVVKDFVAGRLVYATAPPGTDQAVFDKSAERLPRQRPLAPLTAQALRATQMTRPKGQGLDEAFFKKVSLGAHTKGIAKIPSNSSDAGSANVNKGKPWKDHSGKRNRREKLRRVYRHLDE